MRRRRSEDLCFALLKAMGSSCSHKAINNQVLSQDAEIQAPVIKRQVYSKSFLDYTYKFLS